jgi:LPS-assembly protein
MPRRLHPTSASGASLLVLALAALGAGPALAQEPGPPAAAPALPTPMVEFEADQLEYDENKDVITATGNVLVRREGRRLTGFGERERAAGQR